VIVSDNRTQFTDRTVKEWCQELGIKQHFTSVAHPQANGQIELANRTMLHGLKARVDKADGSWVDELPSILWSYRTIRRGSTGETPFSLCYGSEALIPVEIGVPTLRVEHFDPESNEQGLRNNLDTVEELREEARVRQAVYNQRIERYYNRRVRARSFLPGDLVLRRVSVSNPRDSNKLSPSWEGPYRVTETLSPAAYRLKTMDGTPIKNTWNIQNLRKFYQ